MLTYACKLMLFKFSQELAEAKKVYLTVRLEVKIMKGQIVSSVKLFRIKKLISKRGNSFDLIRGYEPIPNLEIKRSWQ